MYAWNGSGLWRYVAAGVSLTRAVYLPATYRQFSASLSPAAQQALDRLNVYRVRAGVIALRLHLAIVAAAQNHANYHMLNYADASAWTNGPHGEVPGKPGFTGAGPWDRIVAAGYPSDYPWWAGSEVMHFIGDPIASVDGWMATIYHRVIPLDPGALYTGYGNGKNAFTAVDVMDFGGGPTSSGIWSSALPFPLAYPADGQTGVPTSWGGGESPDPLPPGASRPVGYPFTLQGVGGTLQVTSAVMRDGANQVVAVHPNPPACPAFNCYALIALAPLQPNMAYTVQAQGNVGGIPFSRSWTFATGIGAMAPLDQRTIGPPVFQPR